jgi:hypothetical protein
MWATAALALVAANPAAAAAQPDLVVKRVSVSSAVLKTDHGGSTVIARGATLRIAERTRNVGAAFARRSTTRYYLRSNDGRMTLIGVRAVGTLAPGESSGEVTEPVYGAKVAAAAYRLVACADGARRVAESSERNNCRTAPGRMLVRDNARPAVFIGGGAATGAFMEDGLPMPVAGSLTAKDADDANLTGATMQIIGGAAGAGSLAFADDRLFFVEQLGITGTYDSGTGVLTLRGVAPVADYQTALRSVLYQYLGDDPPGSRRVRIAVRDAKGVPSAPVTRTIAITAVNDPPILTGDDERLTFIGEGPQSVAPGVVLLDLDSRIGGATVQIAENHAPGQDILDLGDTTLGITSNYNNSTGTLTLTGAASVSDYQTALRSITYNNSSGPPTNGRRFAFQVTDAEGAKSAVFLTTDTHAN